jgi:protein TonB
MADGINGVTYASEDATANHADPMERVLAMEGRSSGTTLVSVAIIAVLLHVAVAAQALTMSVELRAWSRMVRDQVAARLQDLYEIDLAKAPEPPPPPPPPPEEVKEEKPPPPPPPAKADEPPPPPPAAAQAGKVLTQEPDPNEPVDFAGFVNGTADSYAGGVTQAAGTSKTAVANLNARAGGSPTGTGAPTAAPAPSGVRSRPAGLLGSTDWYCSSFWPAEADSEQIDEALVTIRVTVGPDGKPQNVEIVQDPGHGFGLAARRCAMRESYQTALDASGNALTMKTRPFRVRFER